MNGRRVSTIAVLTAIGLVLTACAWGHPGGNAARNAANAYEPFLTVDNVDELELAWQATRGGSEPIITDKYIYTLSDDLHLRVRGRRSCLT